jgi:hypothetical protein
MVKMKIMKNRADEDKRNEERIDKVFIFTTSQEYDSYLRLKWSTNAKNTKDINEIFVRRI